MYYVYDNFTLTCELTPCILNGLRMIEKLTGVADDPRATRTLAFVPPLPLL